ncbi:hypothetical protein C4D60_Mb08t07050 [Musa balbisiana]|uniref:Uncharacterized protein n=1 Tax=Musa balbisiana TaxID=52838 RepID=A0A4S8K1X5_MUSBA|nr:hypothetical protein C4D60_Mb08t07050 [Musa balbisiana]
MQFLNASSQRRAAMRIGCMQKSHKKKTTTYLKRYIIFISLRAFITLFIAVLFSSFLRPREGGDRIRKGRFLFLPLSRPLGKSVG